MESCFSEISEETVENNTMASFNNEVNVETQKDNVNVESSSSHVQETTTVEGDTATICQFYLQGNCRFGDECFNVHSGDVVNVKTKQNNKSTRHKVEEKHHGKKPSLRTAGDVRKRIQWDSDLPEEYFTIGYLDRFDGVVEKPFLAFSWEHIATVGLDDLAIPQHRIQYFKYRNTKVWDKNERLDLVFGSANNDKTILDIIKQVDEEFYQKSNDNDDSSEDSDDDNCLITSNVNSTNDLMNKCIQEVRQREDERATHFLCIKVRNQNLADHIKTVQDKIISEEPVLRSCAMPEELLHVTLAMIKCETPNSVVNMCKLINRIKPKLTEMLGYNDGESVSQQRIIKAEGLSTFGARVLYAKLDVPSTFMPIVNMLREEVQRTEDTLITNHFDFVPHMTVMKVNRTVARERRSRYINSALYSDHINYHFGCIKFDNLHFCSIEDNRGPDNFYVTIRRAEI